MKVAHLSDLHYCAKHLKWVRKAMAHAIEDIAHNADVAVISGDTFDHGLGSHEDALHALMTDMSDIANHVPTLVLQGTFSHDKLGSLDVLKCLNTKHQLLVVDKPGLWSLEDNVFEEVSSDYEVPVIDALFVCLPSINKADPEIIKRGPTAYVEDFRNFVLPIVEAANTMLAPTILVTHGTVNGSVTESKHAMVSPDHEFTDDLLFSFQTDAVMIGHIHAHQKWERNNRVIAYPGSIARLVHGDNGEKGFLDWSISGAGVDTLQFIPSPTRQLVDIEFDGPPDMDELEEIAETVGENDAVRIRWMVDAEYAHSVDQARMREMFKHCDEVKLEGTILPVQSVRAPGISAQTMSLADKVVMWLKTTGDEAMAKETIQRLDMLQDAEPDKICTSITGGSQ